MGDAADTLTPPARETPLLVDARAAARLLGVGRSLFYGLLSAGLIGPRPIRLGRRVLFSRSELAAFVAAGCPPRVKWDAMADVASERGRK